MRSTAVSIEVPLFLSVGPYGALYMTAHKEIRGIRSRTNKVFRSGEFKGHIQEPSHIATFNLKQLTDLRNHEYLPLANQMLDRYVYKRSSGACLMMARASSWVKRVVLKGRLSRWIAHSSPFLFGDRERAIPCSGA